ncbi:uncharacterized protein TNCV_687761 [Trichonephila clavipes]|nr:uncharacterized protein TNCV_687761 [Trichonephila clavipes]
MAFLLREGKDVLSEVAKELGVEVDITLPKIEFKRRICQSKYYNDEVAKCLLEGILEEKREIKECEKRVKREIRKFEERRLAREFELERLRAELRNKSNENELKAGNRINNLVNVCYLSGNHTAEVSQPVMRGTNVFPPSEVRVIETEKNNRFKVEKGKEINVYRSSDCEGKVKAGVFEGSVRAEAMSAQQIINLDDIGVGSLELISAKGVPNPEGLI